MKIILTNWINLVGVFFASIFALAVVLILTKDNLSFNILEAIVIALFSVIAYGMMFWALFIVSLVVLDLILIIPNKNNLKLKLIIEWLIISSPFIYWTIEYGEWIFAVGIVSFFIAQLLREKHILKKKL
jgi:hypothetical protein